jgi:hypothetical protein
MVFYTRTRQEHWLCDKHEDGLVLLLEDESMWEIHPSDRLNVVRWLRMSTIIVEDSPKDVYPYPYLLTNNTEKETARANYLGDVATRKKVEVA